MKRSLLYPAKCIFCGRTMSEQKLICAFCLADEVMITGKICAFCGLGTQVCSCGQRKHNYERRIACAYYKQAVIKGISRFKFRRHTMLGDYYGKLMAENVVSKYANISFCGIVPVPMSKFKKWMRGYNCTELLSDVIYERIGVPVWDDVLFRRFSFKDQKDVRQWSKRTANVLDAFFVKNQHKIKGKTLLLVDDVCTSGATLNECAKMLRLYGAAKVYAVTFAAVAKGV